MVSAVYLTASLTTPPCFLMNNIPNSNAPSQQFHQLAYRFPHTSTSLHVLDQFQQAQHPTPQHERILFFLQTQYQDHVSHLVQSLRSLTSHQRTLLDLIPSTPLPPPPFLPLGDDIVDAVAYTLPLTVESLVLSPPASVVVAFQLCCA